MRKMISKTKSIKCTAALAAIALLFTACGNDTVQSSSDSGQADKTTDSDTTEETEDIQENLDYSEPESTASDSENINDSDTDIPAEYTGRISDQTLYLDGIDESIWEDPKWIEFGTSEYGEIDWTWKTEEPADSLYNCTYESEDGKKLYLAYEPGRLSINIWASHENNNTELYKETFYTGRICDKTLYLEGINESIWEEPGQIAFGQSEYGEIDWTWTWGDIYSRSFECHYESPDGKILMVIYGPASLYIIVRSEENTINTELYREQLDTEKWPEQY